ncbi:hypothetical protein HPB50_000296 [Hyalomma asiaticum]|uniref:Uncharacterized protein n=1 Tax=Hyalomma asiaticum TaxID=266040 RepID=A0ACB7RX38_HYAAI|nr:hypothetical protein HPB50_000296 [Hyalomma asiaticum]
MGIFRDARLEDRETAKRGDSRPAGYFDHCLELSKTEKSFSGLRELIIAQQFIKSYSLAQRAFLEGRTCRTLQELSQRAGNFVVAQSMSNLSKERTEKEDRPGSGFRAEPTTKTSGVDNRCILCEQKGIGQPNVGYRQDRVPEHVSCVVTSLTVMGISM